jgi:hypothetical protein
MTLFPVSQVRRDYVLLVLTGREGGSAGRPIFAIGWASVSVRTRPIVTHGFYRDVLSTGMSRGFRNLCKPRKNNVHWISEGVYSFGLL